MKNIIKNLKIKRRAIAHLAAMHFYGNPSAKLKIIGVTGTNGKTTTSTLLYKIATELGYKSGLIGTVENRIGDEVRTALRTTPSPVNLNKLLKEMVEKGCEYVFMEVSSHALDQKRVAGINFTGGIFTNLTHDHLDYHKSIENYFHAKKKLFQMLSKGAFALSNTDDGHGKLMLEGIKADSHSYGFSGGENFHGEIFKLDFLGLELRFNNENIKSRLLGKFNAYNLLSVWSACKLLGFDMEKVNKTLETIEPPTGRFQYFTSSNNITCIVDYAHTPDALENVLLTTREIKGNNSKVISVFGCGGDRDPLKRRVMGKVGAELSDIAIFTSDNPRSEDQMKIIEGMKTDLSMELVKKVLINPDRREAIKEAVKIAKAGDIILVAGKGHEDYQEIKGVKHHFNDMEELKKLFK
jgi:UDP-N-acetylmuramoyl-L-alanyl-D-glutamate--2,6-diaminopimelate ligase